MLAWVLESQIRCICLQTRHFHYLVWSVPIHTDARWTEERASYFAKGNSHYPVLKEMTVGICVLRQLLQVFQTCQTGIKKHSMRIEAPAKWLWNRQVEGELFLRGDRQIAAPYHTAWLVRNYWSNDEDDKRNARYHSTDLCTIHHGSLRSLRWFFPNMFQVVAHLNKKRFWRSNRARFAKNGDRSGWKN